MSAQRQLDSRETMTPAAGASGDRESYRELLKSSALIGAASAINIVIGIVRNKLMALLLGASGFGVMGLYMSILDVAQSIAGLGLNTSGVRQMAEAAGTQDQARVARTAGVLRRTSLILGVAGSLLLAAFARPVSVLTFGTPAYTWGVVCVSAALLFRLVTNGQGALLSGLRRVGDMAKISVLGGVFGTVISVAFVAWLGEQGIVPALVVIAACTTATYWWFGRRLGIARPALNLRDVSGEVRVLFKLGIVFMVAQFLAMGSAYAVRIIVLHEHGTSAAGLYSAAWMLGSLYIGFILQAMGSDFYPRLTALAGDRVASSRLVNQQTHIGLLLAGPGVMATLAAAPIVLRVFFSAEFVGAEWLLCWFCFALMLRVIWWPFGYVMLAQDRKRAYLAMEFCWVAVDVALAWVCVKLFGLEGAGIALACAYVVYIVIARRIVGQLIGFKWTRENTRLASIYVMVIAGLFLARHLLPPPASMALSFVALLVTGYLSVKELAVLIPSNRFPSPLRSLMRKVRLLPH
jgi:PST family polysaccharide transporter